MPRRKELACHVQLHALSLGTPPILCRLPLLPCTGLPCPRSALWRESRANGADRGHRACRADRPDRAARSHGRNRARRRNRPYRRAGRCRAARAARGHRPDRACRWAARPGGSGRPDRSHRPCRSYRADRSHRPDRSDGYDRTHGTCWNTGRPGGARADRTVREPGRDGSDRTDRGHRAFGRDGRDGACRTDGDRRRGWSDRRDRSGRTLDRVFQIGPAGATGPTGPAGPQAKLVRPARRGLPVSPRRMPLPPSSTTRTSLQAAIGSRFSLRCLIPRAYHRIHSDAGLSHGRILPGHLQRLRHTARPQLYPGDALLQ